MAIAFATMPPAFGDLIPLCIDFARQLRELPPRSFLLLVAMPLGLVVVLDPDQFRGVEKKKKIMIKKYIYIYIYFFSLQSLKYHILNVLINWYVEE